MNQLSKFFQQHSHQLDRRVSAPTQLIDRSRLSTLISIPSHAVSLRDKPSRALPYLPIHQRYSYSSYSTVRREVQVSDKFPPNPRTPNNADNLSGSVITLQRFLVPTLMFFHFHFLFFILFLYRLAKGNTRGPCPQGGLRTPFSVPTLVTPPLFRYR